MRDNASRLFFKRKVILNVIAPAAVLIFMFFMALFSSKGGFGIPGDSGTFDETAHIPAAYMYVHDLDFRFNIEHPPLAKLLSGLSLVMAGIEWNDKKSYQDPIEIWKAGEDFIFHSGNQPERIYLLARLPIMLLMIGLGILLFAWARKLYGAAVGLMVLIMYAFYPDILAHGRLVTTDIAAAFGFIAVLYFFDAAINNSTTKNTMLAGMALGLALFAKFNAILLYPLLFLLIFIKALIDKDENIKFVSLLWTYLKTTIYICLISGIFIWAIYSALLWKTPFAVEHKLIDDLFFNDPGMLQIRNFFHLFANNHLTMGLGHLLLGITFTVARVVFGNFTFIIGEFSMKTFHWFFPVAWLLKTPLSIILLACAGIGYCIIKFPKDKQQRWQLAMFAATLAIYWTASLIGSLSIGIRHILPTVPFLLLLIGFFCKQIWDAKPARTGLKFAIVILIAFQVLSTLSNYPNFISYFNEITPRDKKHTMLVDSSLDWGQDLLRLKKYLEDNRIKDIKIDYSGSYDPSNYIPGAMNWDSEFGPHPGWLAVSALNYQASKMRGEIYKKWSYHWLDSRKPTAVIGGSLLVYNISEEELKKNPPRSPYPVLNVMQPENRRNLLFNDLMQVFLKENVKF